MAFVSCFRHFSGFSGAVLGAKNGCFWPPKLRRLGGHVLIWRPWPGVPSLSVPSKLWTWEGHISMPSMGSTEKSGIEPEAMGQGYGQDGPVPYLLSCSGNGCYYTWLGKTVGMQAVARVKENHTKPQTIGLHALNNKCLALLFVPEALYRGVPAMLIPPSTQ